MCVAGASKLVPDILVMAALLSLGAPFWYNILKNLVNLRSQVAQKQQEEEAAS